MKKALIVIGSLIAIGGIGFLSYKMFFAKKGTQIPTAGGDKSDKTPKVVSDKTRSVSNVSEIKQPVAPEKLFHPGDPVYMATSLSNEHPLFLYQRPTDQPRGSQVGSIRPDWYGIQSIGKFKAYSTDKKYALVTFSDIQIWKSTGTTVGKVTGDYFVPVESISISPY